MRSRQGLPGLEPLPLLAEQGLRLPDLPLQLLGGWDGKPVDVIQRHMGKPRHPRVHIPGNGEVQKQHVVVQSTRFQLLGPDGDVGAAGGAHHHVTLGQTPVPLPVIDAAAPRQHLHPAAAVLPHRHRHLGALLHEGGGGPLAHLSVANDKTPLPGEVISFLPHPVNGQLGGRGVGGGQQELGFHLLGPRNRVAEQHLQGAAAALGLPGPDSASFTWARIWSSPRIIDRSPLARAKRYSTASPSARHTK